MGIEIRSDSIRNPDLSLFQETLKTNGINYRVMGSIAIDSYCKNDGTNSRKNTDLDLLVTRPDYLKLKTPLVRNQLNFGDRVRYDSSISKYIDFRPNEDYSFLVFRDI